MDDQDNDSGCLCGACFRNCVGWNSNIHIVMVLTARVVVVVVCWRWKLEQIVVVRWFVVGCWFVNPTSIRE